jgi:hypothetical protein
VRSFAVSPARSDALLVCVSFSYRRSSAFIGG